MTKCLSIEFKRTFSMYYPSLKAFIYCIISALSKNKRPY